MDDEMARTAVERDRPAAGKLNPDQGGVKFGFLAGGAYDRIGRIGRPGAGQRKEYG
jgi:hypothetical protein